MLATVFDAGPLITACKFTCEDKPVIDFLLPGCRIVIAPAVEREVAILGARYADGVIAGERIARGVIEVMAVRERLWLTRLSEYALGAGERDSMELCRQVVSDALISDDYLAFITATWLGLNVWMLPDLVVELVRRGSLTKLRAEVILEIIRSRYRRGVIDHSLVQLQEV
jgi:predicted nucleic acid-binding protein